MEKEEKQTKKEIILYIMSIILLIIACIPSIAKYQAILILTSILLAGYELIIEGIKNIFKLNFEEDTLMTIAIISAFILGEYVESAIVILLFKLGEFLEQRAEAKAENNIKEIVKIKAETANLLIDNKIEVVDAKEIKPEQLILIKPGEKVPVDCVVLKGESNIDASAITGESKQITVKPNQELFSGAINLTTALTCKALRDAKHSMASQIADLVEEATTNKANTEKFITKFSKIYTPTVIIIAIIIAIIPFICGNLDYKDWINRALIFLVASCPCSLVISVPLAFISCIGAISKKGMLIKGTKHIENLSKSNIIAFDKTGTLTTGKMKIKEFKVYDNYNEDEIFEYIYNLELLSNHPISTALKEYKQNVKSLEIKNQQEIAGCGMYGIINENEILFGNTKLLEKYNIKIEQVIDEAIYIIVNKKCAGYVTLTEEIREEAKEIVSKLKKVGIEKVIMLTGDNKQSAKIISDTLKIDETKSSLLPKQKLDEIEKIKQKGKKVIFVGDGINDSPVLVASSFGISMGSGTSIANNTADSILISNNIGVIPIAIRIAKKSMRIIRFNITFSILIKIVVLILGILGIAPIWLAVFADTGVTFLTVLNSTRIHKIK